MRRTLHKASVTAPLTLGVLFGLTASASFAQAPLRPVSGSYYFVAARPSTASSGPSTMTHARTNSPPASDFYPAQGAVNVNPPPASDFYPAQGAVNANTAPAVTSTFYPAQGAVAPARTSNFYPTQGANAPPMAAASSFYPAQGTVASPPRYYYFYVTPPSVYPAPGYLNPYAPNQGAPGNLQRTSRSRPRDDDDDYAYKS